MADPVLVTASTLLAWPLPAPGTSKEQRGRVLVVGGTAGTPGAVRLAGEAALRAGAGKLRLATVATAATELAVAVPECKVIPLAATEDGHIDPGAAEEIQKEADEVDAMLVGSGCTDLHATVRLLEQVLPQVSTPVVLDGLASAYLTEHPDGLSDREGAAVLTANPGELAHVVGTAEEDVEEDPLRATTDAARRCGLVILCGGADKHVVAPDGRAWSLEGGGPGLGVSGSGDVQAGIVAGLLARGAEAAQAAVWGAFVHARVGEQLATQVGTLGYLARELPPAVPGVMAGLQAREGPVRD